MPSPVTDRHQEQVGFLFHLLDAFRWERGGGVVLMGPAVLRLDDEAKPEPDIFVRPAAEAEGPQAKALLVIEILSPSTRAHDLGLKLTAYKASGLPEVWLVDDRDRVLIAVQRVGEAYREVRLSEGALHSTSLPGFWLDVAWLWERPLPNPRRCLEGDPGRAARLRSDRCSTSPPPSARAWPVLYEAIRMRRTVTYTELAGPDRAADEPAPHPPAIARAAGRAVPGRRAARPVRAGRPQGHRPAGRRLVRPGDGGRTPRATGPTPSPRASITRGRPESTRG